MSDLLLALELLLSQSELFFITLSLEALRLFKFTLVHFCELGSDLSLVLLLLYLKTSLLFFQSLATDCIFSFVFGAIGFIHGGELLLPVPAIDVQICEELLRTCVAAARR